MSESTMLSPEHMKRRCKFAYLDEDELLDILQWGRAPSDWRITINSVDEELPADVHLHSVNYDVQYRCFRLLLTHPSFDEVQPGSMVPNVLQVKITLTKDEE